jgi:hypothetical protein
MTIEEAIAKAMRAYPQRPDFAKGGSIRDLAPEPWPPGNERLSEDIDITVYEA